MGTPEYRDRTADEIISAEIFHNALGFGYRAASWADFVRRTGDFAAFHYLCIDGRLSIEHLIFDQLHVSAGSTLTKEEYCMCLTNSTNLKKMLRKIVPDYEKLQEFTEIVASLSPEAPKVNKWDINSLMKLWGNLSSYLHWGGYHVETTSNIEWQKQAIENISQKVEEYWIKLVTGHSACMVVEGMNPNVREVWEGFHSGKINSDSVRIRLELMRSMLKC